MEYAKNLSHILGVLDNQWIDLTSTLTEEQLNYFEDEIKGLENKLGSTESMVEINEISKDFCQIFSKLGPLEFMARTNGDQLRSGSLNEKDEAVKIKLLNYCVILKKRITVENNMGN